MSDPTRPETEAAASPSPASAEDSAPAKETPATKPRRKLPGWLDHFNARDLKVLFRCSVAAWVASLLIFIEPSLRSIGTAAFFATLVLFMVPPTGIVFIFILAALTLIVGMAWGWVWGIISMKAALAARPAAETQAQLQILGQTAYSQANATGQPLASVEQVLVYEGWMLDARVTAVYFCMICFMIYLLARLRAKNPKFALFQIFGTISLDIFLTIGPLLPSFSGTIPKVLIEPAAIGIGLGLASSILFFPKSTSSTVLDGMEAVVRLLKGPTDVTYSSLIEGDTLELKDLIMLKMKTITAYKKIEPALGFLQLDFSVGRWNADDVKSLKHPLRQALLSSLSLLEFHIARLGGQAKIEKLHALTTDRASSSGSDKSKKSEKKRPREVGMRQLMESVNLVQTLRSPEHESLRREMLEAIQPPSKKILPACQEASTIIAESVHAVNSARWFGRSSQTRMDELLQRSESTLETLQGLRSTFAAETTERLIETYSDIFDENGVIKSNDDATMRRSQGIVLGMVFEEQVLGMADGWERVLAQLVALMKERQRVRLWLPRGLRYAYNWVFRRSAVAPVLAAQSPVADPDVVEAQLNAAQQSLRISRGYKVKQRSGLGKAILGSYHWFISAEGMYALRLVIVTIALAIPAAIPSSAGFYYREKGLWALIMGQTTVVIYMSDFSLSIVSRAIGTVVGGVAGLVAWYIGSGNGNGNPYGLAATMAVVITLLMWARLFAPLALLQATMMGGATCILVIGYSYEDTHFPAYGNPGWGYNVFWRRLVLVLVGSAAALIVQVFPRPPSAARHICKSLSNAIRSLSDHYALLLSCWGQPDRDEGLVAEQLALDLAETLASLDGPVALLRLEFSSSPFDSDRLAQVKSLCQELNQHLGRLLSLSASLPEHFQQRLARHAGLLDNRNIGDIMAVLAVVEQALKTGDPLPEVLPTPLLKRCFEFWKAHQVEIELSKDLMRDENYRKFCVAVSSYLKFLGAVDDLVLVMKGTLGESHVVNRELMNDLKVAV
ncbi:hypothetical protein N7532_007876 [Penicillium argentinense]|uniref:ER transporter 6TM N-terminal domain-containing protein n=1 Tax=Penicillium argentinense TaxID=1131581 RepID=A0A9W9K1Z3_9EURO|nr:uncharacterized protein N7532_007876 [Penicillium argentinense]KAJ5089192.1 hypothetical protein N7532_007876 [Penicillium argentinense]